jgi:hypothetical protein
MPEYVDLLKIFEEAARQQEGKQIVLELPRPLEEIFPEIVQDQSALPPLRELLKKEYEHLVTTAFNIR